MTTAHPPESRPSVVEQQLLQSGGFGKSTNSARSGFLPVALHRVPVRALEGIPIFLRVKSQATAGVSESADSAVHFALYCADTARFGVEQRDSLLEHHVRFIYIRMSDQDRFRRQMEARLSEVAGNPALAVTERSAIVYETSVELINELLAEPELLAQSPRLEHISRSITTLVMNDPSAFSHLYAASFHDFYTATHMVNVATWMVPLAYELGHHDSEELNVICHAGMLHDMGKVCVPPEILNKSGKLSEDEWAMIKRHPEAGYEYLSRYEHIDPLILTVTREHHERADGSGYPQGLKGDQIHPISRICAVVDSFDAMTAFRPFKNRTLSVAQAMEILQKETPIKYDPEVMEAWLRIMNRAEKERTASETEAITKTSPPSAGDRARRKFERQSFHCPARIHEIDPEDAQTERPGVPVVAHSISRSGLGFLSQTQIPPGTMVHVYLEAKGWGQRPLQGQTVRCRQYNDLWYEVGLQFADTVVDDPIVIQPLQD